MEKWKGKVAIVTGASSGIGEGIALALLANGLTVINLDRNIDDEKVERTRKTGEYFAHNCDLSDLNSLRATFAWIEEKFTSISVLVSCAGVAHNLSVLSDRADAAAKINNTIDVNFTGAVHVTREAFRLIKKSDDHGMIINVASLFGHIIPFPIVGNVYAATKFAVRAFSEIVRQELIASGCEKVRVSNISPGTVKTNVRVTGGWENVEEFYEQRPFLEPKELADAVLYLLSTPCNVNVTELIIRPVGERF